MGSAHAAKVCSIPDCPQIQPCPIAGHTPKAWESSTRRTRTVSGSRQQKRARFVLMRDDGICHVCGLPGADEADHIIPTAEGGPDNVSNMGPIHSTPCHDDKTRAEAERGRQRATPTTKERTT